MGGGPAGALISVLFSSRGYKVDLYDKDISYSIPCGEAIPAPGSGAWWGPGNEVWKILENYGLRKYVLNEITGFDMLVGLEDQRRITYDAGRVLGYIIDKPGFIDSLREMSDNFYAEETMPEKLVDDYDIVVDARGPLVPEPVKRMAVVQAYASGGDLSRSRLFFHVSGRVLGYFWAFPVDNDTWNIGTVCLGCSSKQLMEEYRSLRDLHGFTEHTKPRGWSILAEIPRGDTVRLEAFTPIIRVGEAAGHVMYHSGEGIRPAFLSAWTVFNVVHQASPYPTQMKLFVERSVKKSKIHKDSIKSHHILELMKMLHERGILVKVASRLSARMWLRLFNGRIEGVSAAVKMARALMRLR